MNTNQFRLAGWSALIVALVTVFTIVTAAIGFTAGWEKVGLPNDLASIVMYLFHIPVLLGLDKFLKPRPVQLWLGILAAFVVVVVQVLFVGGAVEFEFTPIPVAVCSGVLALVYIAYFWQARQSQSLPNGLTLIGLISNAGGALASPFSLISYDQPIVWIGGSIYMFSVVSLFWLGRIWLRNPQG